MKNQIIKICNGIIITGLIIYGLSATTTISGQSIGIALAFFGWIFRMIIKKEFEMKNCPFNKVILVFFTALFISCLFSTNISQSLNKLIIMIGQMILYYLVICGIKTKKNLKIILSCLIITTFLESIYVIYQFFFSLKILNTNNIEPSIIYIRQQLGTLDNVNSLAVLLSMILPLSIVLSLEASFKKRQKVFLIIFNLIIFISLIFTFSRGAWITFFVSFIFIAIFKGKQFLLPITKYLIILILIISIIISIFFSQLIFFKIKNAFDLSSCTNKTRILFWKSAITMLKTKPITGMGLNTFRKEYYTNYQSLEGKKYGEINPTEYFRHFHAHNNFLNLGAETGLLGLSAFILLLFVFLKTSFFTWKNYSSSSWKKNLTLGLFIGIIAFLIYGLFDFTFKGESGHLFWFLIGMIVLIKKIDEKEIKNDC